MVRFGFNFSLNDFGLNGLVYLFLKRFGLNVLKVHKWFGFDLVWFQDKEIESGSGPIVSIVGFVIFYI